MLTRSNGNLGVRSKKRYQTCIRAVKHYKKRKERDESESARLVKTRQRRKTSILFTFGLLFRAPQAVHT